MKLMKRDELYAKYIGVMNINAVLKQQNADMLEVLKEIAEAENILFAPYSNVLYFRDLVNKAKEAIANYDQNVIRNK